MVAEREYPRRRRSASLSGRPTLGSDQWLKVVENAPTIKKILQPKLTKYIPHPPHPPQSAFLIINHVREVMFGGAAGGGKSDAMLMAALQYVDIPGYSALLLRRTTSDHKLPGSIMDRAQMWLANTDAKWRERDRMFVFPSGAKLVFGFLEHENDKYRYASAEFQFIGFDELTQFMMTQYTFMFSRLRRLKGARVPIRMRSATNPIGEGAEWVRDRWGINQKRRSPEQQGRIFIPSKITDNPSLDREEYLQSLNELDPVTREQLLAGNWEIRPNGGKFRREYFRIIDLNPSFVEVVRYWDLASSDQELKGGDPDWTVGVLMGRDLDNRVVILDVIRVRRSPGEVEKLIKYTAARDSRQVRIRMSQDPGQAGVSQIDYYSRFVLQSYNFDGVRESGDKLIRGDILAAKAYRGEVYLKRGHWNEEFLSEAEIWPLGSHDDQIDAAEGARRALFEEDEQEMSSIYVPSFGRSSGALTRKQTKRQATGKARSQRQLPRRIG